MFGQRALFACLKTDSLSGRLAVPAGSPCGVASDGLVMETVVALGLFIVLINLRGQEVTKVKPLSGCTEAHGCTLGFASGKTPSQCPVLDSPRTRTAHKAHKDPSAFQGEGLCFTRGFLLTACSGFPVFAARWLLVTCEERWPSWKGDGWLNVHLGSLPPSSGCTRVLPLVER